MILYLMLLAIEYPRLVKNYPSFSIEIEAGKEMKKHFEMIRDGNLRAAIKPQQISHIARAFDGTAAQLLEKYDERGAANTLVKDLGLENSMHKELSELSGGEMQRLATAAVASRDVDFYFFDEPSSYNDVYQRTGVARVIHALANCSQS